MKKNIIKKIGIIAVSVLALSVFAGCGTGSGKKATKVRIATQPSVLSATALLAKEKGYLEEELKDSGVEVKWTSFENGPSMNEAFAAGEQDIGVLGDVPLLLAKSNGQKNSILIKAASGDKTVALVASPNTKLENYSELKGKKVGYVVGSYAQFLLYRILEECGLTFNDIESVNLGNADIPAAIESGEIDFGVIWEPVITSGVNNGQITVIADGKDLTRNNVYYEIVSAFEKENPEIAQAYANAIKRAAKDIKDDPEAATKSLSEDIELDPELLAQVLKNFDYSITIDDEDISQLTNVATFIKDEKLTDGDVDVKEFVLDKYSK